MGGDDRAYRRNEVAAEWKVKLADLKQSDPGGYEHVVQIHKGKGHWMDRQDAVAVPWMAKFKRNPVPRKVVWEQDDVTHDQFYWLAVPPGSAQEPYGGDRRARRSNHSRHVRRCHAPYHPL